jgi:hypothetical protein
LLSKLGKLKFKFTSIREMSQLIIIGKLVQIIETNMHLYSFKLYSFFKLNELIAINIKNNSILFVSNKQIINLFNIKVTNIIINNVAKEYLSLLILFLFVSNTRRINE